MRVDSDEIIKALERKQSFYAGESNTDTLIRWGLTIAIDVVKDYVKDYVKEHMNGTDFRVNWTPPYRGSSGYFRNGNYHLRRKGSSNE